MLPNEKLDAIKNYLRKEFDNFDDVFERFDQDRCAHIIAFTPADKKQRVRLTIPRKFVDDTSALQIANYLNNYQLSQDLTKNKKIVLQDSGIELESI